MRRFIGVVAVLLACNAFAIVKKPDLTTLRESKDVREIRAGVICYGGVSLAIYMYGNARELHHLAMASSALECDAHGGDSVPPPACAGVTPGNAWESLEESAKPYYEALVDLWDNDPKKVRTRFVVDVISGTSAGGINGVFLAKALTNNAPIDRLRDIWFEQADIARLAGGRPWQLRALLRLIRGKAALGGDGWLKQLRNALDGMDQASGSGLKSLLLPGQQIELLVPATDFYGSERVIEIGDPPTSSELRYDHVFRFSAARDLTSGDVSGAEFNRESNVALAFAARSSASFPVAFPAIRLEDLKRALDDPNLETAKLAKRLFKDRLAEFPDPDKAAPVLAKQLFLVDGGVLDNYPFGIAYDRVSRRSPARETRRVFIYLEPDPRATRLMSPATENGPGAISMLWNAKASIPGAQPIAQNLIDISQHNHSVNRIVGIIRRDEETARAEIARERVGKTNESADKSVATRVEKVLDVGGTALAEPAKLTERLKDSNVMKVAKSKVDRKVDPGLAEIHAVRGEIEKDAAEKGLPLVEEAYKRLRVESVLDQFARVMTTDPELCKFPETYEGPRLSVMREVVRQWAENHKLTGEKTNPEVREEFLAAFDVGYLRRRLRFVNEWLNQQYPGPGRTTVGLSRDQLEKAQKSIGERVTDLSLCLRGGCLGDVPADVRTRAKVAFCAAGNGTPDVQARAILVTGAQAITDLELELEKVLLAKQDLWLGQLYKDFVKQTIEWGDNKEAARAVLARYLGFPYWDRVTYPYTAFTGLGDLTHIDIVRMSPTDTLRLNEEKADKLKGAQLAHFGAFFGKREDRERDYLWGRVDGAERLLTSVLKLDNPTRRSELLDAIVDEEAGSVSKTNLDFIRNCVDNPPCKSKAP